MSNLELVLTMLADASTKEISESENPQTFEENKMVANKGGKVDGDARNPLKRKRGNL